MMFRSLGAIAVLLMTTSLTQAAFDAQTVAAQLKSDGYTSIEIKVGQTVAKVEAIKGTTKIEVTYDIVSGDVIKTESSTVESSGVNFPDVLVRDDASDDDDSDVSGASDDDEADDVGDDHGDDAEDGGRDDDGGVSGSGGGDDDAEDDDHGDHSGSGGGDDDGQDDDDHGGHGDDDSNDD